MNRLSEKHKKPYQKLRLLILTIICIGIYIGGCMKNPTLPQLTTQITDTSSIEIKMVTTITTDGGSDIFEKGMCWSPHPKSTIADFYTRQGNGNSSYETILNGFETITYYFRAYAVNGAGIGYGTEVAHKFTIGNSGNNNAPNVEITYPPNSNFVYYPGQTIDINLNAYDTDGTIVKIELYANNSLLATLTNNYTYQWTNAAGGEYSLSARAYDNAGAIGYSNQVTIKVLDGLYINGIISELAASEKDTLVFGLNQTTNKLLLINPSVKSISEVSLPFAKPISMDYAYGDSKLYIIYAFSGSLTIWDNNTREFTNYTYSESAKGSMIKADPVHRRLYILSDYGLFIVNMDNGNVLLSNKPIEGQSIVIDPDKELLVSGTQSATPSSIFKYSVAGDTLHHIQTISDGGGNGRRISINPAKGYVVLPSGGGNGSGYTVWAFSIDNLNVVLGEFNIGIYPSSAAFTHDGLIMIGTNGDPYDNYIYVMNAESFAQISKIAFPNADDYSRIVTNFSGTKIVAYSYDTYYNNQYTLYFYDM
jgi:hypothetical protein